jgi:hypothetical protein
MDIALLTSAASKRSTTLSTAATGTFVTVASG